MQLSAAEDDANLLFKTNPFTNIVNTYLMVKKVTSNLLVFWF